MLTEDRPNLWYEVYRSDVQVAHFALEVGDDEIPKLSLYKRFSDGYVAGTTTEVSADGLDDLALILQHWARKLRAYQSHQLTNNLFEE